MAQQQAHADEGQQQQQEGLTLGVPVDQETASELIVDTAGSGVMYVAVPAESSEGVATLKRFLAEGVKELLIQSLRSYYSGPCVNSDHWRPNNEMFNKIRISLAGLRQTPEEACKLLATTVYDLCLSRISVKGAPSFKLRGDILLAVLDSESCGGYLVRSHNLIGWEGFVRFALILARRVNVNFGNYLRSVLNGDQKYTKAREQALDFFNMPLEVLTNLSKSQLAQDMAKHCMDIASRIERACVQLLARDHGAYLEHVTALSAVMSQLTISSLCLSAAAHTATLASEYVRLLATGKVDAQIEVHLRRAMDATWDGTAAGTIITLHKVVKERKDLNSMDLMEAYYDKHGQYLKKITKDKILKHAMQKGKEMAKSRGVRSNSLTLLRGDFGAFSISGGSMSSSAGSSGIQSDTPTYLGGRSYSLPLPPSSPTYNPSGAVVSPATPPRPSAGGSSTALPATPTAAVAASPVADDVNLSPSSSGVQYF